MSVTVAAVAGIDDEGGTNVTVTSERQPDGRNEGPDAFALSSAPTDVLGSFDVVGAGPSGARTSEMPDLWDDDDDDELEPRTVMLPVSSVTALGGVVVVLGLLVAIWVIGRAGAGEPAAPTVRSVATTVAAAIATTAPVVSKPAAPTTAVPATTATTLAVAAPSIEAFCQASADYSLTSLVILGERAVADPKAAFVAYEAMVANAPAELAPAVEQLRPLSALVLDEIVAGRIKTPAALRDWLADRAHWPAEATWLQAQKKILPTVKAQCPA